MKNHFKGVLSPRPQTWQKSSQPTKELASQDGDETESQELAINVLLSSTPKPSQIL